MRKLVILNIVFAFLLVGCEKTIDFIGDKTDPIIVVNSIISPDSVIWVKVTKSLHISESGNYPVVTNAEIDIFEDGNLVSSLTHKKDGIYSSDFFPLSGKDYEIKVITGNTTVKAETNVPETVDISSLELRKVREQGGNENIELTINFNDPGNVKDYYIVPVLIIDEYVPENDGENIDTTVSYWAGLSSNDPVLLATFGQDDAFDNSSNNDYNIFTDELINGKSYDLKVLTNTYAFDTNNEGEVERKLKFVVYFSSISEEYFYFLKSRNLNNWYKDDPFSEPVPIYSNIKGGAGILGAYSTSVDSTSINY